MVDRMLGEEGTKNDEANGSPMWKFLEEEYDYKRPKRGDIRYAEVLSIDKEEIIVDIGGKTEGVVPSVDLERMGEEAVSEIAVGDKVPVYVLRPESADGDVIVSLNMARTMEDWRRAEKLYESGDVFEGPVAGHNKGGLLVYFGQIRGFVPASQLSGLSRRSSHEDRMQTLSKMEGQQLLLKVIEVDRQRRRLIFSERAASREYRDKRKTELLDDLQEGDIRTGTVRNLCDFGAFVDLGGADGLIHISELSWRRVRHARDVLRAGQEVEVYVLRVDRDKKRIGLSLKRLQPDPWQVIQDKYQVGQIVKGVVTNIVDFGAFARIEDGIEGLIHVSELSDGDFAPQDLVREGEQLYVKILSIDSDRQRMGLSLKQAPTREEMEGEEAWAEIQEEVVYEEEPEAEEVPGAPVSYLDETIVEVEPELEELEEVEFEAEPEEPLALVVEMAVATEAIEAEREVEELEEVEFEAASEEPLAVVVEMAVAMEVIEPEPEVEELQEVEFEAEPEEPVAELAEKEAELELTQDAAEAGVVEADAASEVPVASVPEVAEAGEDVGDEVQQVEDQVKAAVTESVEDTQEEPGVPDTEAEEAPDDVAEGEDEEGEEDEVDDDEDEEDDDEDDEGEDKDDEDDEDDEDNA